MVSNGKYTWHGSYGTVMNLKLNTCCNSVVCHMPKSAFQNASLIYRCSRNLVSGWAMICHQARFPWNNAILGGFPLLNYQIGVCAVVVTWGALPHTVTATRIITSLRFTFHIFPLPDGWAHWGSVKMIVISTADPKLEPNVTGKG